MHTVRTPYLSLEEQLITGKNMPSKLKFLNDPFTMCPLNVNVITGTVKSSAQPITSPFLIYGSIASCITTVLRPPTWNRYFLKITGIKKWFYGDRILIHVHVN